VKYRLEQVQRSLGTTGDAGALANAIGGSYGDFIRNLIDKEIH